MGPRLKEPQLRQWAQDLDSWPPVPWNPDQVPRYDWWVFLKGSFFSGQGIDWMLWQKAGTECCGGLGTDCPQFWGHSSGKVKTT